MSFSRLFLQVSGSHKSNELILAGGKDTGAGDKARAECDGDDLQLSVRFAITKGGRTNEITP